uniref:uncharacterized protein LOC114671025 n=1 Tax=Macaca mulatta TaxID=9544 RepID=UPI0010A277BF|nr:uncharacterized protein LOC114671025 [Macaca mulatta]
MGFFENQGSLLGEGNGPVLCICQLAEALALSGRGGVNLEPQLGNITGVLFQLLHTLQASLKQAHLKQPGFWAQRGTFSRRKVLTAGQHRWTPALPVGSQVIRRRSTGDFPAKRHQTRGACQGSGSPASLQGCVLQSAPDGDLEEGGDEFSGSADTEKSETFVLPEGLQRKGIWKKCPKAVISPTSHRLPAPCRQSNVGPLWMWEVPQMLQILDGEDLLEREEEWGWAVGPTVERMEFQAEGRTFLWVRTGAASLSLWSVIWVDLLMWAMLYAGQTCSPESCGSRLFLQMEDPGRLWALNQTQPCLAPAYPLASSIPLCNMKSPLRSGIPARLSGLTSVSSRILGSSCRSWSWMAEQSCCSPATGVCSACPRQK